MSNDARVGVLRRLRGASKSKLTRLEKFLTKTVDKIDLFELKGRISDAAILKTDFECNQNELESIVAETNLQAEYQEREEFEERLSVAIAKAKRFLFDKEPAIEHDTASVSGSGSNHTVNDNPINIKLPALKLPTFSGSYEQWPAFSDVFKSSVHNDTRYTDSQKLVYLRSCLTGKAADKIESIETTDANYQVAWKILKKCYDDPTAVINNHIKSFFELPNCSNTSANAIGDLTNNVTKHYRALEALKKPFLEAFPIYAVISKLDPQSRLKWKEHTQDDASPTMEKLLEFLHCREKVLESNKVITKNERSENKSTSRNDNQNRGTSNRSSHFPQNRQASSYSGFRSFCYVCKNPHFTQNCNKLLDVGIPERLEILKNLNLCINCLRSNHTVEECKSSTCKTCDKKHHTILHSDPQSNKAKVYFSSLNETVPSQVLLQTALVHISDHKGNPHICRALLDSGSQVHFMTERLAKKLGLNQRDIEIPLGGVNQMSSSIKKVTRSSVQSRFNTYSADLSFLITQEINEQLPTKPLNQVSLKIPPGYRLADPNFHEPGVIDLLIGSEIFFQLLGHRQEYLAKGNVVLQETKFGWVVGGKIPGAKAFNAVCNLSLNLLHNKISKFWEIENVPHEKILSKTENKCEEHYAKNTTRDPETGRYIVKLPFKDNVNQLGESYKRALNRFHSLERSFAKKPEYKDRYQAFMKEYEDLGHMTEDPNASKNDGYFFSHHGVTKESSLTTNHRTVFNGKSETSTGISINDTLMVGPSIQEDLFSLLIRFRSHAYAVTADIEKMYRQIYVHPDDRKFQKILWRENPFQPIKIFTLNTVTYGTSPASFLATRSLVQLANDEGELFPKASIALKEDFYMDDLLTGATTFDEAKSLINELKDVTRKGGMHLRQWASNDPELISTLSDDTENSHLCLNLGETTKTLGVYWNPQLDIFKYTVDPPKVVAPVTKRTILSQIAQLFDPLGLLGPVILRAKILMQSLWDSKLDWDDPVPQEIHVAWLEYQNLLPSLQEIKIDRKIVANNYISLQLLGFCDASEKAYGANIYIRSTNEKGEHSNQLVCSKSRVAPLKKLSLPRLELCAALLLANLFTTVSHALRRLSFEKIIFHSDSTITLHWIKSPSHTLKTFEGNRVAKIQETTANHEWRHVRSEHNPADLISRGLTTTEILDNSFWFNGPAWINDPEENWPVSILELEKIPGQEEVFVNLTCTSKNVNTKTISKNEFTEKLFARMGTFLKLIRVIAYCQRFIDIKIHKLDMKGILSTSELKKATICAVKLVQRETFSEEIAILKLKKTIQGKLTPLQPILDSEGVLRVGGRLELSELTYSQKHPILLPKYHHLTNLIVRDQHLRLLHAGAQATLNTIRDNYWIVDGRNVVRNIIRKCVTCFRAKPRFPTYIMGDLPKDRTVFERPFKHAGVDFCGPFFIKEKKHRNRVKVKIYAAVFVCFATKAVHIEIVSDLTSEAFLACLKRFFARRGKSSDLYSDNATYFKGAKREIDELYQFLKNQANVDEIAQHLANHDRVAWHFIPPRSPHFGGLWEAAVKSFKHHFTRAIDGRVLTYEEFTTFATEVEGILNSRPLTPVPSDPNDLIALTPGHFLIDDSITSVTEHDLMDLPSNRLSSWQQVQQIKQHFWARWKREYLHELTVRKKWHKGSTTDIQIGSLVTIRDDNLPPMRWSLGRLIATNPGPDKIVRVVTVRTAQGVYKRSIKNLSPLPIDVV